MKDRCPLCPRCQDKKIRSEMRTRFTYTVGDTVIVRERWCKLCQNVAVYRLQKVIESEVPEAGSGYLLAKQLRAQAEQRPSPGPSPAGRPRTRVRGA